MRNQHHILFRVKLNILSIYVTDHLFGCDSLKDQDRFLDSITDRAPAECKKGALFWKIEG